MRPARTSVPLRTAQATMRPSDPSLNANVYTDPKLLDVAGALEALPSLDGSAIATGGVESRHADEAAVS